MKASTNIAIYNSLENVMIKRIKSRNRSYKKWSIKRQKQNQIKQSKSNNKNKTTTTKQQQQQQHLDF